MVAVVCFITSYKYGKTTWRLITSINKLKGDGNKNLFGLQTMTEKIKKHCQLVVVLYQLATVLLIYIPSIVFCQLAIVVIHMGLVLQGRTGEAFYYKI